MRSLAVEIHGKCSGHAWKTRPLVECCLSFYTAICCRKRTEAWMWRYMISSMSTKFTSLR